MSAFGSLPFQFQQRGNDIANAVERQDTKVLAQHITKRDQDLEDYLGSLHGGGFVMSQAIWSAPTVNSGSNDLLTPGTSDPDWAFAAGTGDFDGGGVFHGAGAAIVTFNLVVAYDLQTATVPGLVTIRMTGPFITQDYTVAVDPSLPSYAKNKTISQLVTEMATSIDGLPTDPTGSTPITVNASNMGIAGLTGPDALVFDSALLYVFVARSTG